MTLEQLEQQLVELANSGDAVFAQAAQQVSELTQQALSGQLSSAELKEILEDMQRELSIVDDMSQLAFKEKLNTVLTGLITIACFTL